MTNPVKRCAIYIRKSSEEGLEQDFNSLHAQREACESFIKSQKHEGWNLVKTAYDDGGFSGGTMERPALKQLMTDITAGKIDVIVVYKVDRLSRSLHDFARMVEVFDKYGVSFVSVTQQFNTMSSMGRLTLNVLLSFAQFEREVTGERIRDKIAASKKKGIWMGGVVPLGYEVKDRKLLIHTDEAQTVRWLFTHYLEVGYVRLLRQAITEKGIVSRKGCCFSRGMLYGLLANPIYIGKIRHQGVLHEGEHAGIIEQHVWEAVQQQLKTNGPAIKQSKRITEPSLLTGKLFDVNDVPLSPTHANKKGKRYRYYVSRTLLTATAENAAHQVWRLPAHETEQMVLQAIVSILSNKSTLSELLSASGAEPQTIPSLLQEAEQVIRRINNKDNIISIIASLVQRITLHNNGVTLQLSLTASESNRVNIIHTVPLQMKRRGQEMRLVIEDNKAHPDASLIRAVARAHAWLNELTTGKAASISAIAAREKTDTSHISRLLKLAFLPPSVIESIVAGTQPAEWTVNGLIRNHYAIA